MNIYITMLIVKVKDRFYASKKIKTIVEYGCPYNSLLYYKTLSNKHFINSFTIFFNLYASTKGLDLSKECSCR